MSLPYIEFIIDAAIDLTTGGVVAIKHSDRHAWKQSTTAYVVRDTSGVGGKPSDAALTTYKIPVASEKWSTDLQHVIISGAMPALSDEGHALTLLDSTNNEVAVWLDYNQAATDAGQAGSVANADQTVASGVTYDGQGNTEGNVDVEFQLVTASVNATGTFSGKPFTTTSAPTGSLSLSLLKDSDYRWSRGLGKWHPFNTGTASTYDLGPMVGGDEAD